MKKSPGNALLWFRRDLRLNDNPALSAVLASKTLVPVYILDSDEQDWKGGAASNWWLHHSLKSLDHDLRQRGSQLLLRCGSERETLFKLVKQYNIDTVVWNRRYEPQRIARDKEIKAALQASAVQVASFNAHLINEPWAVATQQGKPYRVFTPYWKSCQGIENSLPPAEQIQKLPSLNLNITSEKLEDLGLLPDVNWYGGLEKNWKTGEYAAHKRLDDCINKVINHYQVKRDYPAQDATSRLSPHLCFGEISPRRVLDRIHSALSNGQLAQDSASAFSRQLYWREFAYHLLYHFPATAKQPLNEKFKAFPWQKNRNALKHWQRGETGIPIVDAGMRELWQTGWMHNRVRMIVASLLTKNLGIHWLEGARWFWDTLVDADLANNTLGWQWVAGCGADAAPYYRIFNPVTQAQRFDEEARYIRHWVPELASLDNRYIFAPWQSDSTDAKVQRYLKQGLRLDLKLSRDAALARYDAVKN